MIEHADHLATIGFVCDTVGGRDVIYKPDGTTVSLPAHVDRIRHMGGRLDNVRYMARAMDRYDGIEGTPGTVEGDEQFEHLIRGGHGRRRDLDQELRGAGLIYFALRRHQRAGNLPELRRGLVLLMAFEDGQIALDDVLGAVWDHDWQTPAQIQTVEAKAAQLSIA